MIFFNHSDVLVGDPKKIEFGLWFEEKSIIEHRLGKLEKYWSLEKELLCRAIKYLKYFFGAF